MNCPTIVRDLRRCQASLCKIAMVRIDAGFPSAGMLAGLEARGMDYIAPARQSSLDRLAALYMKRPLGCRPIEPRM
jgi:hypothetical protein